MVGGLLSVCSKNFINYKSTSFDVEVESKLKPYQNPQQVSKVISLLSTGTMYVKEVGKMDQYLWYKGWLLGL